MELANSSYSVCIIEKELKNTDDRTWCFWEKGPGKFDHILYNKWDKINFYANSSYEGLDLEGYSYKMIRSSDFYTYAHSIVDQSSNITRITSQVESIVEESERMVINTSGQVIEADRVLNSVIMEKPDLRKHNHVIQHFGGWFIETEEDVFDEESCTFMDFRIEQKDDTRFFYVLPFSKRKALIEIAILSNDVLEMKGYDALIQDYLDTYFSAGKFHITEKEIGQIPMTDYPFYKESTRRHIKIGTAGGWVKPSSGYAFKRIIDRAEILSQGLLNNEIVDTKSDGFSRWMDRIMLKVLTKNYLGGKEVFGSLFDKKTPAQIFQFLDEENSFMENISIMSSSPIIPFTRAVIF
jgi:lycopene beta-cyclase